MLFVHFSSTFNKIIPHKLVVQIYKLRRSTALCLWINDFLMNKPQVMKIHNHTSSTLFLNTDIPQGRVSPALYTLFTHACIPIHSSNIMVKFADDIAIMGLVTYNDKTHHREEIRHLVQWCSDNCLVLMRSLWTTGKPGRQHTPQNSFTRTNLSVRISSSTWKYASQPTIVESMNTSHLVKKDQQRLFFLRKLRWAELPSQILANLYRCTF